MGAELLSRAMLLRGIVAFAGALDEAVVERRDLRRPMGHRIALRSALVRR